MLPTFSIVLPVYATPPSLLIRQLESIRTQTWVLFECIIVDDGSPDPSLCELIERWATTDHRFSVHRRPRNGGIAAATNDAVERARFDFVVFCDHDDSLMPDALEAVADEVHRHPATDVVYSDELLVDADGAVLESYRKPDFSPYRLLGHNYFNHLTVVRRALLPRAPLRTEFEPTQDFDLLLRVVPGARRVGHLRRPLYRWRAIPGSVATAVTEKHGVAQAVRRAVTAACAQRQEDCSVSPLPDNPAAVRVRFNAHDRCHVQAVSTESNDTGVIDAAIRAARADTVVLVDPTARTPEPQPGDTAGWPTELVALAARDDVGVAGARLVTADGALVSAGRVHGLRPSDQFHGSDASGPGPWGAFQVLREVASVAPLGAAFRTARYRAVGGLATDLPLQVAMADLCVRLRLAGYPSLSTPSTVLTLPAGTPGWTPEDAEMSAWRRRYGSVPELVDDPYDPLGASGAPSR